MTPLVRSALRETARPRIWVTLAIAEGAFVLLGAALPSRDEAASAELAERVGLVGGVLLLGGLAAAAGAGLVAEELRSGRAAAFLARAVPRWRWVLARMAGLALALLSTAIVLAVAHGAAMATVVTSAAARDAVTSRRFVKPEPTDGESTARLAIRFSADDQGHGHATLRGRLELTRPVILPEQQLTVRVHLKGARESRDTTVFARPRVPFDVEAPRPLDSATFEIVWPEGTSPQLATAIRLGEFVLLLDPTSRAWRVAKAFALLFLASLAVAGVATAASAVVSTPVALAVALCFLLIGFAPDAIPDSARLLLRQTEPPRAFAPRERPGAAHAGAARFESAIDAVSKPLPDLLELWPGEALDAGVDPALTSIPRRVTGSWPHAAAALLLALLAFSRRDL